MRSVAALAFAALLAVSGCLSASGKEAEESADGPTDSGTPSSSPQGRTNSSYDSPKGSPSPTSTNSSGGGGGGGTGGNATPPQVPQKPWPAPDQARIRPGVQTSTSVGQCTSNFVFRSPDNATLYLGSAAHCVKGLKIGDSVTIQGATKPGKVAYSAWMALKLVCNGTAAGTGCTADEFENDFALIAIDPADRGLVSPAVQFFGGPTALMDSKDLDVGDRMLVYGHSGLWFGQETLHHHEGVVTGTQGNGLKFYQYTVTPGIQGDSGSGVLTRDGRAAGILVTLSSVPPAETGVTGLKAQLDLAKKHGMDVQLATWGQLNDGMLPG